MEKRIKKNLSNEFIWRLRILCVVSQHNKNIDRAQHSFPFVPTNNSDGDDGVLFACIWHCLELLPSIQWTRWNSHVQLKKNKTNKKYGLLRWLFLLFWKFKSKFIELFRATVFYCDLIYAFVDDEMTDLNQCTIYNVQIIFVYYYTAHN